jgi:hypothetical protein
VQSRGELLQVLIRRDQVTGSSTAPGRLTVGVLLPVPGTWRMFLLTYMHGQVLTVSYTLNVT